MIDNSIALSASVRGSGRLLYRVQPYSTAAKMAVRPTVVTTLIRIMSLSMAAVVLMSLSDQDRFCCRRLED